MFTNNVQQNVYCSANFQSMIDDVLSRNIVSIYALVACDLKIQVIWMTLQIYAMGEIYGIALLTLTS
jgi:hypothetical protein